VLATVALGSPTRAAARIITEFPILTSGSGPLGITVGPSDIAE